MRVFSYRLLAAAAGSLLAAAPAPAQDGAHAAAGTPGVNAHRATDIVLDGRLSETVWSTPD
ncbi:hypothetical protein, partial [Longimicrobium sp.]|uniref:hypothetical protein n=1 Tax=Longimicrobium sp. TaxID=2029185 RepID=UPI002E3208BD